MAWVGSYWANECAKCGEYFPADLKDCPFCVNPKGRTHHNSRDDDYDD